MAATFIFLNCGKAIGNKRQRNICFIVLKVMRERYGNAKQGIRTSEYNKPQSLKTIAKTKP